MKTCGVYSIMCLVSRRAYVGSSTQIEQRWYDHRWALNRGNHHCRALLLSWKKHGAENFEFKILEKCPAERLVEREQSYLDTGRFEYNSSQKVRGGASELAREKAREHCLRLNQIPWTKERREAASRRARNRVRKPASAETRAKQSVSAKLRKQRDKAMGVPGPWAIRMARNPRPPRFCACGCSQTIGRQSTWARGHNKVFLRKAA